MSPKDPSRRALILGAASAAATLALARPVRAMNVERHGAIRPRALIQIHIPGGLDAILTTDPKTHAQVEKDIDLTYDESAIRTLGARRVGPHFAALGASFERFAVLNGVRCSTVAHAIGMKMFRQLRRSYVSGAPSLCTLVGSQSDVAYPLDEVSLGVAPTAEEMYGPLPRTLHADPDLFADLLRLSQDGVRKRAVLTALTKLRSRDPALAGAPGWIEHLTLETTGRLIEVMPADAPRPASAVQAAEPGLGVVPSEWQTFWNTLPLIVWLLEHHITPSIYVKPPLNWDTHFLNDEQQHRFTGHFALYVRELLALLDTTRGRSGAPLSSEVGIVMGSELGRFPRLNPFGGKDHLPELPVLLAGPGVRPGTYGETDRRMLATPISLSTGRPGAPGGRIPTLEDVGATMLRWFGARDPLGIGYVGDPLEFLFA